MSDLSLKSDTLTESSITLDSAVDVGSTDALTPRTAERSSAKKKVLMVSSSGGHWVQMNRLKQAFAGETLYFASTDEEYSQSVSDGKFYYVPDASKASSIVHIIWQALCVLFLVVRVRPDVVVSTGAAPGYFALVFAKKLGAKTVWVDSIANVDKVSLSGRKAARHADLFITQWEHLASEDGPVFYGSVL